MATPPPTAVLIVGMHRSGTSALAGLVGKLGVPLGERLLAAGSDNPKGYWEHEDVVALHERLLSRLGSRWDDVRALPDGWGESEAAQEASSAIGEVISRDFSGNVLWAIKDPRLCRVLPLWVEVLQQHQIRPVVLFMVRNPREVAASIEARNHWHPLVGKLMWLRYMTEALKASSELPREVVLYDDLLADPIPVVTKAFTRLGVKAGSAISVQQRKVIADFVDVADRHHTTLAVDGSGSELDAIAEQLYESLVAIAHGANRWSSADKIIARFHREWQKNGAGVDAMADMAARIDQCLRSKEADNFRLHSELAAQIRWSEEAKAKHEMLQAENAELASKLAAQIRWSEEAQAKHDALHAENAVLTSKLAAQIRWSEEAQAGREALQAQNAELSSKLAAQIRWSEEAQAKHDALHAENAELTSKLAAQIRCSEEAQAGREALQAQNAELSSKLAAQIRWSEETQAKQDGLQAENAELSTKLSAQIRCSEDARENLEASRKENARVSSSLTAQILTTREMQEKCEALAASQADLQKQLLEQVNKSRCQESALGQLQQEIRNSSTRLEMSEAEAARAHAIQAAKLQEAIERHDRLGDELEKVLVERFALATELERVYASASWKMTKPLRSALMLFRNRTDSSHGPTRKPQ